MTIKTGYQIGLLLIIIISETALNCHALSFEGSDQSHLSDFYNVFESLEGSELKSLYKSISYDTIDKLDVSTVERIDGFTCGNHRWFGHWGFTGSIPFEKDPLKSCLAEKHPNEERLEITKNKIRELWAERVKLSIELVQEVTGLPYKQAQAFAAIVYDVHILGDFNNTLIDQLVKTEHLKNDLIKNIEVLFKNDKAFAETIINEINAVRDSDDVAAAKKILALLKKHPLGESLYKNFKTTLISKGIVPIISGETINSIKNRNIGSVMACKYNNMEIKSSHRENTKIASKAAAGAAVISGLGHSWSVYQGEEDATKAIEQISTDSVLAGSSMYLSEAVIQKVGNGKYAITALVEQGGKRGISATSAALNFGVATFIFDETINLYKFMSAEMTRNEFFDETAKAGAKAIASSGAVYCTVLMGASAGGPVVMAVAIGSYIAVDKAISVYSEISNRNYLSVDDILLLLPYGYKIREDTILSIGSKRSHSVLDEFDDPFKKNTGTKSILDVGRDENRSILSY